MHLSLTNAHMSMRRRHVLHEFGHVAGCIHGIRAHEEKGWSKGKIDRNVLSTQSASTTDFSDFDTHSIMMYPIPGCLTDYKLTVGWNKELSAQDKRFITRSYPLGNSMGYFETSNDGKSNTATIYFVSSEPAPPQVAVGLNALDTGRTAGGSDGITSYVAPISSHQFTIHVDSWQDTLEYYARVSWLKLMAADPDFQCGTFACGANNMGEFVRFERSFPTQPIVYIGLSGFGIGSTYLYTSDIACDGFAIHLETSNSSKFFSARATWIAYPGDKTSVLTGDVLGSADQGWSGDITFATPFDHPPVVFAALTKVDVGRDNNIGVRVHTSNASTSGMNYRIMTSAPEIRASYLALDI